jgi:hypothetical protein
MILRQRTPDLACLFNKNTITDICLFAIKYIMLFIKNSFKDLPLASAFASCRGRIAFRVKIMILWAEDIRDSRLAQVMSSEWFFSRIDSLRYLVTVPAS